MNKRIRQGLGLLVVSVIAFLVMLVLNAVMSTLGLGMAYQVVSILQLTVALVLIVSVVVGLALLAWGLLRPPSDRKTERSDAAASGGSD